MPERTTSPSFCVYLVTNTSTGKQYVGVTQRGVQSRWREHLYGAKHHSTLPLHSVIRKYGAQAFQVECIEQCADHAALMRREQHWVATYGTVAPHGYNVTIGGDGHAGVPLTPEHRAAIARANRENVATRCTPAFRQRMHEVALQRGPEHMAKIAAAPTGRHHKPEAIEKVRAARAVQVFSAEANERRAAANRGRVHTIIARAHMSRAQKGRTKSALHRQRISQTLAKLTDAQAAVIRYDALGRTQKDYAVLFHLSPQAVNGIVKGRNYRHVTHDHLPDDPLKVIPNGDDTR